LQAGGTAGYIANRQIQWAVVGCIGAVFAAFFDYRRIQRFVLPILVASLVMLVLVLIVNDNPLAPKRTFLNGSIQPSELAKVAIIVYLSAWLYSKREHLNDITFGLIPMMAILGVTAGLILLEPDLSAAATIVVLGGILFFMANGELRQIILVIVAVSLLGYIMVTVTDTGRERFLDYINGLQDPQRASYHVQRSMEAVVRGGVFGVGIGKGTTKFTGLPVPWTDSIFAVITEETGLIGAVIVVGLYILLLWRGLTIAQRAPDMFGRLLAGGLSVWIALEAFVNIGVMVNLVPFAGNALPLMSAGGSNMTMTLVAVGIIMSVSRMSASPKNKKEGNQFHAVADLRRRNGGRDIPRRVRS
jgi:cell division protein FtsW